MFTKYEKSFKIILRHYYQNDSAIMTFNDFSIPRHQIDYLAAKGLIHIDPYVNDYPNCRITITDKGIIYFDEKHTQLFRFWIPVVLSFLALVISICALIVSTRELMLTEQQINLLR